MSGTFDDLLAKYGTPYLVMPNPQLRNSGNSHTASGQDFREDFLLVRHQLQVARRQFTSLKARLTAAGYQIIEHHPWFALDPARRHHVRLTLANDVIPISRTELEQAAAQRRILHVETQWMAEETYEESWCLATPERLDTPYGYSFLFPTATAPGGLSLAEVPATTSEGDRDATDLTFHYYQSHFTRDLPLDIPWCKSTRRC